MNWFVLILVVLAVVCVVLTFLSVLSVMKDYDRYLEKENLTLRRQLDKFAEEVNLLNDRLEKIIEDRERWKEKIKEEREKRERERD